jgi:hypothetical protein
MFRVKKLWGLGVLAAIPFWGYWHATSHAVLQVALYDIALKNDRQAYGSVLAADVDFKDATGKILAHGRADKPWGTMSMVHPTAGDCRREEREGGVAWQQCFAVQSRWLITWTRQARQASVRLDTCTIHHVPVLVEESRDAWWLWWVPLPHIDNSTYTHFKFTLWVDSARCRAAETADVTAGLAR